jgi:hypothetical protein
MNGFIKNTCFTTLSALIAVGSFIIAGNTTLFAQQKLLTTNQLTGGINTITTAVPFLLITPDSRAGGMGDAGVATSPDANSIHWNASKLAFVDKQMGFAVSYTPWLRNLVPDINLAYLSGYYKAKKDQVFAGSLRYFSLGDITFTDVVGNTIGQFRPNEFALDAAYARKFSKHFSGGMAVRYIYSNLTNGVDVLGAATHAGKSGAVDISGTYRKDDLKLGDKKSIFCIGLNISNIGAKIAYSGSAKSDFLPINLRLGTSLTLNLDEYNTVVFALDVNKLLVPTPPQWKIDSAGHPAVDAAGNREIAYGKDPYRSITSGIFGSFSDAPGGYKEELREINYSTGIEYWYDKQFAARMGFFYEDPTKGNRKYFTLGAGVKYNVFGLDFAYLIPTDQRNPLENTLRFTLFFDFDAFKSQNEDPAKTAQ